MAIFWHIYSDATDASVTNASANSISPPTSYLLKLELTFRTVIIWDSKEKPVTCDATDATVTNVTDTAKFMYSTHMPGCTTWYIYNAEPLSIQSRSNARVRSIWRTRLYG